jgi:acetolactate synthase-1/2/3 large subunit
MDMNGAHIVWECLRREGVDTVFGYPGGNVLSLYDALQDFPSIRHVLARHEQGACHMADGYARAGRRTGVVLATSGPGATNLVTGLATAMMDSVPLVAITGQVGGAVLGTDAFQEVDFMGVTLPITKHNYLVQRAEDIAPALREAFAVASHGRPGPVVVDITRDAQQARTEPDWDAVPSTRHLRHLPPTPSRAILDQALSLIRWAKQPLILAGHGVILSGAVRELMTFAERSATPIATTLLGIGAVPAGHPLNLGMMGLHGEAWANQAIQEADLILALGMRFDDRVTGEVSSFAPQAKKIHVEVDACEINKNIPVNLAIHGDLREVLDALLPDLEPLEHRAWLEHLGELRGHARAEAILEDPGALSGPQVIHALCQATRGRALVVTDVGQHQMWEAQYYKHEAENSLITSGGLGTMGFALPAAIGAKLACPDREVWVINGDGGFQMNMQELMTLVQEGIKINIAIINNGYLGMVRQLQEVYCEGRYAAVTMANPDFVKLADAFGMPGLRVSERGEVASAIQLARHSAGPYLLEFQVDKELSVYPMVPAGASLGQMMRRNLEGRVTP